MFTPASGHTAESGLLRPDQQTAKTTSTHSHIDTQIHRNAELQKHRHPHTVTHSHCHTVTQIHRHTDTVQRQRQKPRMMHDDDDVDDDDDDDGDDGVVREDVNGVNHTFLDKV